MRTLASEDTRKAKLFTAWISYLNNLHAQFQDETFEEFYEGMATVSELSKDRIGLRLEDDRTLRHISIVPEISAQSCRLDQIYVVLGRRGAKWWPLDVISIGSVLGGRLDKAHISYNPLHVNMMAQSSFAH